MSFAPVYNAHSRALILGTWPSPKSREMAFYYGHPQNRFWPMLAALTGEAVPAREDIEAKKQIILRHGLALWDTLERCTITKLIPKAMEVCVTTDAGQKWTINVDLSDPDQLYLGGVSYDHGLGYRYWAFLNEQNFWSWREWYILTTHLNNYIAFTSCDVEELANERNLQIARILYDVLANGNLGPLRSVTFEPLSDSQMQHQDE